MSDIISPDEPTKVAKSYQKKRFIPLLTLLLVIVITLGLYFLAHHYPEKIEEFKNLGYLGVFLICVVSNASIILPVPGIFLFVPLLTVLNPVLIGLVGATGGTIGEVTGYIAGYSGRAIVPSGLLYDRVEGWMKRWGAWVIFIFAAVPFLFVDIAGMVAGALRFPLWKFLLVVWVGKSLKYVALLLLSAWGWEVVLHYLS
ncbi:YqaA family protein [Chloroflexota bacterium]